MQTNLIPYSPEWYEYKKQSIKAENKLRLKNELELYTIFEVLEVLKDTKKDFFEILELYIKSEKIIVKNEILKMLNYNFYSKEDDTIQILIIDILEYDFDLIYKDKKDFINAINKNKITIDFLKNFILKLKSNYKLTDSKNNFILFEYE
jgi:hypothetical protein